MVAPSWPCCRSTHNRHMPQSPADNNSAAYWAGSNSTLPPVTQLRGATMLIGQFLLKRFRPNDTVLLSPLNARAHTRKGVRTTLASSCAARKAACSSARPSQTHWRGQRPSYHCHCSLRAHRDAPKHRYLASGYAARLAACSSASSS